MATGRFRIKAKPDAEWDTTHPDGTPTQPYGLWDTLTHRWVDKWGRPDEEYSTCCRGVAEMRRRDMNDWERIDGKVYQAGVWVEVS